MNAHAHAAMPDPTEMLSEYREILLEHIEPSATNAQAMRRKAFDKPAIVELASSIAQLGLAQPILVRPIPTTGKKGGHYEIVAGERRYLAFEHLGRERIPCTVRHLGDEQVVELQLIENLQREDLHPMHEAESYDELVHKFGHQAEEIAAKVGKSRSYVYNRMKLLALSKACRKAFYDGELSASIAEKIARIPTHDLQDEALEAVLGFPNAKETWKRRQPMSFRQAAEHINENFTLDLAEAPFPTKDEKLNGVGPCTTCPKRTGNAPDLFPEIKKKDTCTDTACFAAKTRAYGQRLLEQAKTTGQKVLVGPEAKKVAPDGVENYYAIKGGYKLANVQQWNGSKNIEPAKILKPGAELVLLQDPRSGKVVEVVHESQIKKPKQRADSGNERYEQERKAKAARAKHETAVRLRVFAELVAKGKWKAPPIRVIAELVAETMDYDAGEALMNALAVPEPKKAGFHDRLTGYVASLKTDAQLEAFVAQCHLAEELHVNSYDVSTKAPRLEAAAKAARIDVGKIRKELAPKKAKPAKKGGRK